MKKKKKDQLLLALLLMPLFQGLLAFRRHGFKHVVIEDWEQWICFFKKNSALTFSFVFILFYSTWYGLPLNLQF